MTKPPAVSVIIRQAREAKGMSQSAVAKALNISRAAVSYWESGRAGVDKERVRPLATLLDIKDPMVLLGQPLAAVVASQTVAVVRATPLPPGDKGPGDFLLYMEDEVDRVTVPTHLTHRQHVYGFDMPDNSMEPRYHRGERIFADSAQLPADGDYCVVWLPASAAHPKRAQVRRFLFQVPGKGRQLQAYMLQRYGGKGGPSRYKVTADKIEALHRVIPTRELVAA
jgi:transcriptional regulator with XRE-family HTH domain